MKVTIRIFLVTFLLNSSFVSFAQGKLDKSKEDLNKGSSNNRSSRSSDSSFSSDDDDDDNFFVSLLSQIAAFTLYYSFIGGYGEEDHLQNTLTRYPYSDYDTGNYLEDMSGRSARLDIDNKFLAGLENIYGNHLKAKLRPSKYIYFQTDYIQLVEDKSTSDNRSYLSLFNFDLCYDRLRFERFNLGWTIGANYVGNNVNKIGFSAGVNADIFLGSKVSLYSSMRWGEINAAPVNEFEAHLKYHINRFSVSGGFEHMKIGIPTYNFATVGIGFYL